MRVKEVPRIVSDYAFDDEIDEPDESEDGEEEEEEKQNSESKAGPVKAMSAHVSETAQEDNSYPHTENVNKVEDDGSGWVTKKSVLLSPGTQSARDTERQTLVKAGRSERNSTPTSSALFATTPATSRDAESAVAIPAVHSAPREDTDNIITPATTRASSSISQSQDTNTRSRPSSYTREASATLLKLPEQV